MSEGTKRKKLSWPDKKMAISMVEIGVSQSKVAEIYGVSRQYISALVKRLSPTKKKVSVSYRRDRPDRKTREKLVRTDEQKETVRKARAIVNAARDAGLLVPQPCEVCGATKSGTVGKIEGHHDDYRFPLNIRWLCSSCHRKWHAKNIALS